MGGTNDITNSIGNEEKEEKSTHLKREKIEKQ